MFFYVWPGEKGLGGLETPDERRGKGQGGAIHFSSASCLCIHVPPPESSLLVQVIWRSFNVSLCSRTVKHLFFWLLYPSQGHGEPAYGCRQGPPLDVLKVKMIWHLSLPKLLPYCVCTVLNWKPSASQPNPQQSELQLPSCCMFLFIFLMSINVVISTLFHFGLTPVKQVSNLISTFIIYLQCVPGASVEIMMDQVFFHSHSDVHSGQLHKRITTFKKKEVSASMEVNRCPL